MDRAQLWRDYRFLDESREDAAEAAYKAIVGASTSTTQQSPSQYPYSQGPHTEVQTLNYSLNCELSKWAKDQLEDPHDLSSALTVSGGSVNAYATTCAEYIALNWPKSPWPLLELIEAALKTGKQQCKFSPKVTRMPFAPPTSASIEREDYGLDA